MLERWTTKCLLQYLSARKRTESFSNSMIIIIFQLEIINYDWHYLFWNNMPSMQLLFKDKSIFILSLLPQKSISPRN